MNKEAGHLEKYGFSKPKLGSWYEHSELRDSGRDVVLRDHAFRRRTKKHFTLAWRAYRYR